MKACCATQPDCAGALCRGRIALVGNPNAGKTTLFNCLTGARQRTGNWPGVTVERKTGQCRLQNEDWEVVDLPGTYSLDAGASSADEQVSRRFVQDNLITCT
ncbi:MAG: FeoB small GTPase domain-containing protein [Thiolinea sp.]